MLCCSGYMSPEYAVDGLFSVKSDVYSFGVLVLEIVSGRRNRGFINKEHHHNLLGHVSVVSCHQLSCLVVHYALILVQFLNYKLIWLINLGMEAPFRRQDYGIDGCECRRIVSSISSAKINPRWTIMCAAISRR